MGIKELFNNKPRCQHFSEDGSRCKADPQTGKPYCFFHDPDQKEKQAAARKQGGQIRSRTPEVILPPGFKPGPLKDLSQVHELLENIANYVCSGEMDLRTGRFLCHLGNSVLAVLKERTREQRRASGEAARAGKKPHYDRVSLNITPIAPNFNFDSHSEEKVPGANTIKPYSAPGKQDKSEDKAKPDQGRLNTVSPDSAAGASQQNQQPPQRYERILHRHSHFPPVIIPKPENKAPQQNVVNPDPVASAPEPAASAKSPELSVEEMNNFFGPKYYEPPERKDQHGVRYINTY